MNQTLYDMMDWAAIEELVYSESSNPHQLLGPHVTEQGLVIQAFIPTAESVTVKMGNKKYPMDQEDENGFFAVLIPRKTVADYTLLVCYDNQAQEEVYDPYSFESTYNERDLKRFQTGIHYKIYDKMGAHPMEINGVAGVCFSVWAPCAMRVSVVGDFNLWDGRRHQMRKLGDSGVFELFIPGLRAGSIYKYEIKMQNGDIALKADPYGNYSELRPDTASIVWDINQYQWQDKSWTAQREAADGKNQPMAIYEVHLGSWKRKEIAKTEDGKDIVGSEFYNYREIAHDLAQYVKEMGYTHIELMPIMEHPLDASWGYQVTGYYAPTSRYGTPDDFMYFVDYMHSREIGVILDWVPAHFPKDAYGLACFDGTCVYEHKDPRQGMHPHWGTLIYNYGRPEVANFLIANALFWAEKYHVDGIRMDAVASMLYLDYGKNEGEWVPNIYGGHENLEAVEFLKHLNSIFKDKEKHVMLIAEESTAWPQITGDIKKGSVGFHYKWNMGWMNDFLSYMRYDPYFRSHHYGELTFSLLYAYSEDFILVFSHDEVVHGKGSLMGKMPGATFEEKSNNLRAAYGFMMGHPGKKLLFMGQEFAQISEWNENESLPWNILQYPVHKQMQDYVKALNHLYISQPALYEMDDLPDGFEWINCSDHEKNIIIFLRKTHKPEDTLLFVCNFAPVLHEKRMVGVPFHGRYKEIFSSDALEFGGFGAVNQRAKTSKAEECDEREESIVIQVAPMSVAVFSCAPLEKKADKAEMQSGSVKARSKRPRVLKKQKTGPESGPEEEKDKSKKEMSETTAVVNQGKGEVAVKKEEPGTVAVVKKEKGEVTVKNKEPGTVTVVKKEKGQVAVRKKEAGTVAVVKKEKGQVAVKKKEPGTVAVVKKEKGEVAVRKEEPGTVTVVKKEKGEVAVKREEPGTAATGKDKRLEMPVMQEKIKPAGQNRQGESASNRKAGKSGAGSKPRKG